jgi:2-succinyl-5-enolpyruvyl-6-hydroxy-3-cyclohexene-1-carboxylate synthase
MTNEQDRSLQLATYIGSFFDELARGGIHDVVISPGSRSTPLSMMAYASDLEVYVDIDERGAAFFALGLAKATGRAVALICTSGTAVANYYPAVLEAESSRVPLLVLSGDRPARLQQLGAPQTCDQLKLFGDHVRKFWNMPELNGSENQVKYARQIAREALAALEPGRHTSAPVHINFPFDEPLMPAYTDPNAFTCGRSEVHNELSLLVEANQMLDEDTRDRFEVLFKEKRVIALCGEGTLDAFDPFASDRFEQRAKQAHCLIDWAHRFDIALLADPLSQLRNFSDDAIIDNYDNIFGRAERPEFDLVVRFGRYPVSKRVFKTLEDTPHLQIVVDPLETRDFNAATTTLVKMAPLDFVRSFKDCDKKADSDTNIATWNETNNHERDLIMSIEDASFVYTCTPDGCFNEERALEGAYVQALFDHASEGALIFSANSMAIRALDTFYVKPSLSDVNVIGSVGSRHCVGGDRRLTVLANRGLNGIDGTLSSALGAAQAFNQTYFLTGDLTLLHDLNALALQHEFKFRETDEKSIPSIIIILFNNGGGGIFDMLPQKSADPYFERLFLTPQAVDFQAAAKAFEVLYKKAADLEDFRNTLEKWNGTHGVHLLEVEFSLDSLSERFRMFQ